MSAAGSSARSRRSTVDPEETNNDPTEQSEAEKEAEAEYGDVHDGVQGQGYKLV